MSVTIKQGHFGFYLDRPQWTCDPLGNLVHDITKPPMDYFVHLKFKGAGVKCPLQSQFATIDIVDEKGTELTIHCGDWNMIFVVTLKGTHNRVSEFTIQDDHGLWAFINECAIADADDLRARFDKNQL